MTRPRRGWARRSAARRDDTRPAAARRGVPLRDPDHGALDPRARAGAGRTTAATGRIRGRRRPSGTIEPMTVPRRVEAASLLLSLDPPPWFVRHARAVAEVAGWLAARDRRPRDRGGPAARGGRGAAPRRRTRRSRPTIRRAPSPTARDRRTGSRGRGTPSWRARSPAIRSRACSTVSGTGAGRRSRAARSGSSPTPTSAPGSGSRSMDARFASWRRRYPNLTAGDRQVAGWDDAALRAVRARAARLEADVCQAAGVAPADVRRLAWTGDALRAARGTRVTTVPIAYVWGDDEYAHRAHRRATSPAGSAAEAGAPLERWDIRLEKNRAAIQFAGAPRAPRDGRDVRGRHARRRVQPRAGRDRQGDARAPGRHAEGPAARERARGRRPRRDRQGQAGGRFRRAAAEGDGRGARESRRGARAL